MTPTATSLDTSLGRSLAWWRGGSLLAATLRLMALLAITLLIIVALDLWWPMPERPRLMVRSLLVVGAVAIWAYGAFQTWRFGRREIAAKLDEVLNDPRKPILAALELESNTEGSAFLRDRAIEAAATRLRELPSASSRPRSQLRFARWFLLIALALAAGAFLLFPDAIWTGLRRLADPLADIPPYSPYQFVIEPADAKVIYGSDLDLSVAITGAPSDQPVYLLTRWGDRTERVDCFRNADSKFTQRLEKVTTPLEFAFATGKTRSTWQRVNILLEPQFSLATIQLVPPAYTEAPSREMLAGSGNLKALVGTQATLRVTSNRPLSRGELKLSEGAGSAEHSVVGGRPVGPHTVEFAWTVTGTGGLSVRIFDALGTPCAKDLVLQQTALPDEKPNLSLIQPPGFSLATASSLLPVEGIAQDDFGLRRVELVRSIPSYRERSQNFGEGNIGRKIEVRDRIELAQLGVQPGNVLEFYMEGRDRNPAMSGVETSAISRVEIISDEQYAEMLRERVLVEDLSKRLQLIQSTIKEVEEALQQAAEAAGKPDAAEKLAAAIKRSSDAAATLEQISKDYPAYDLEKAFTKEVGETAKEMQALSDELSKLSPEQAGLDQTLTSLKQELTGELAEMKQQVTAMDEFVKIAKLMEAAAKYKQLAEDQRRVARWADRLAGDKDSDPEALKNLQAWQTHLKKQLDSLPDTIRDAANQVSDTPENSKLKSDSLSFAEGLRNHAAGGEMEKAIAAAANSNRPEAARAAREAANLLEDYLSDRKKPPGNCSFSGMCQGQCSGGKEGNKPSLSQMLKACLKRGKMGSGGEGGGIGGVSPDGYAVEGEQQQLPVFGPPRMNFDPNRKAVTSFGSKSEGKGAGPLDLEENDLTAPKPSAESDGGRAVFSERVPEKYRAAVKRYFSESLGKP